MTKKHFLFIIISVIFIACNKNDASNNSTNIGKRIIFPKGLYYIENNNIKPFDIVNFNEKYKLIIPFGGECPSCIPSIKKWVKIIDRLKKGKVISFFILDISDTAVFNKMIYPLLPKGKNYILNLDYRFEKYNNLMVPEIRSHGLLINEKYIIISDEIPLIENASSDKYSKKINKLVSD